MSELTGPYAIAARLSTAFFGRAGSLRRRLFDGFHHMRGWFSTRGANGSEAAGSGVATNFAHRDLLF
jgi:hypothetical protein